LPHLPAVPPARPGRSQLRAGTDRGAFPVPASGLDGRQASEIGGPKPRNGAARDDFHDR
jgi:hypothetical protein